MTWDFFGGIAGPPGAPGAAGAPGAPGGTIGNALLAGGGVINSTGYTYIVSAAQYQIGGTTYTSPQTQLTLTAADATFDRIDVLAVNSSGAAVVVTGTAAANPAEPTLDPATQLKLIFIYVAAGSSSATVSTTNIYLEDTEWTTTSSGATIVKNSTNNPYAGTKDVEATAAVNGDNIIFNNGSAFDTTTRNTLALFIRSKASWPNSKSLVVQWYNSTTARGSPVTIKQGAYAFDSTVTGSYQLLVVPMAAFGVAGITVDRIKITTTGGGGSIGWYIDNIIMQAGVGTVTPSGAMVWKGAYSAAVQYFIDDVVTYGGGVWRANQTTLGSAPPTNWTRVDQPATQTLTDQATIAWNVAAGVAAKVTLTASRTMGAPTNLQDGGTYILRVIQGGSGSYTVTWNAVFKWPGGVAPTLTTTVGGIDIMTFVSDGTNLYGVGQLAFA